MVSQLWGVSVCVLSMVDCALYWTPAYCLFTDAKFIEQAIFNTINELKQTIQQLFEAQANHAQGADHPYVNSLIDDVQRDLDKLRLTQQRWTHH